LLRRLALFWVPVGLALAAHEALLWRTGETWPIGRVLAAQERDRAAVFMRGFVDQSIDAYKWEAFLRRRPAVIALGSSRVMHLRGGMFGVDAPAFYNLGGILSSVHNLSEFSELLPATHTPRVILLGVDPWWFNAARPPAEEIGIAADGALRWQGHLLALREIASDRDLFGAALGSLWPGQGASRRIGLHARLRGEGFRFDGSLDSGLRVPRSETEWRFVDRERPPVLRRIRRGTHFFEVTDGLSPPHLAVLRAALARLRARGVLVAGFAPPLASQAAALLEADPRHARLWREYREQVPAVFAELGQPYFDASTPATLGLDDRYLIDGLHAEETFHLHVLRRMLEDARLAAALPTASVAIRDALASPRTNFWRADFLGGGPDA
jgi:hypothetical protein